MKYLIALLLLCTSLHATDNVTIAVRTNQFSQADMLRLFEKLNEHVAADKLSDNKHGLKTIGSVRGGNWLTYTNTSGHMWMVNNFRKSELEDTTYTKQRDGSGEVTNIITHGKTVDAARIADVINGASTNAIKIEINSSFGSQMTEWGLFQVK